MKCKIFYRGLAENPKPSDELRPVSPHWPKVPDYACVNILSGEFAAIELLQNSNGDDLIDWM
jgi:hypothetical protein